MQGDNGLNNPLDVDDLLSVHAVYRTLTSDDKWFDAFPSRHLGFVGIILTNTTIAVGLFNSKRFLLWQHHEAFRWNDRLFWKV